MYCEVQRSTQERKATHVKMVRVNNVTIAVSGDLSSVTLEELQTAISLFLYPMVEVPDEREVDDSPLRWPEFRASIEF